MVDRLPQDVTRLIGKHIHGVSQLELLLFLHNQPTREVSVETVAKEQGMRDDQASILLEDLTSRGLLVEADAEDEARYRYEPKSRELARQVDALAKIYPTYRHAIIQLIYSKPGESVMNFAEAFRLRKDEDDDG